MDTDYIFVKNNYSNPTNSNFTRLIPDSRMRERAIQFVSDRWSRIFRRIGRLSDYRPNYETQLKMICDILCDHTGISDQEIEEILIEEWRFREFRHQLNCHHKAIARKIRFYTLIVLMLIIILGCIGFTYNNKIHTHEKIEQNIVR